MNSIDFELTGDYIELIKLIKLLNIADSGAQAKIMVENGEVLLNDVVEFRKRAKLKIGDKIQIFENEIYIKKESRKLGISG